MIDWPAFVHLGLEHHEGIVSVVEARSALNSPRYNIATTAGLLLLLIWCVWWTVSLVQERMLFTEDTWIRMAFFGPVSTYGVDFLRCIDRPTRIWLAGLDQYADREILFPYAPIINRLFIWVALTTPENSLRIWICVAAAFAVTGAVAAVKARRELGLNEGSIPLAVAAILFSTPVLFSLQRANYDLLILPAVIATVILMKRRTTGADALAALLLAIVVWGKIYPGLLGLGVLALGRWRLAAFLVGFSGLIGLADLPETQRFLENLRIVINTEKFLAHSAKTIHVWNHPLGLNWPLLWAGTPLARLPGNLGAALLLVPLTSWVSWRIYQCHQRDRLALPYLFWVLAAASFVPVIANDYNLTPLPLAILATWSVQSRWSVHLTLAALALWWQPISLPIPGNVLMFIKLAGLIAAAVLIVDHATRLSGAKSSNDTLPAEPSMPKQPQHG